MRQWFTPACLLGDATEDCSLATCTAHGVRRRSGITANAIQQAQPKLHRVSADCMCGLVHETFDSPVGPTRSDRTQVARSKCSVSQVVAHCAYPLCSHRVPVVGALNRERIIRSATGILI